ncbi:alkaline phosphatase [bacterium SCSIO 12741]|nr:alkaline phosphatase [bacterium SCSIO 12741]
MKTLNSFLLIALLAFVNWGCQEPEITAPPSAPKVDPKTKNVIFLIGDGMGLTQVSTAFYFSGGVPNFSKFRQISLINTSSRSHKITDSAAGATAFACGKRTYNGAIGMDADTQSINNITEILAKRNIRSGLVSTSSITHATPACFFAHADSRRKEEFIASQMSDSEVDFFAGGGSHFFNKRKDGANYIDTLKNRGFEISLGPIQAPENWDINKKYGFLADTLAMPSMLKGRGDFLPEATQMALDYLSQDTNGFFLMVEGSQIDWGGHANNSDYIITEVEDFDKTIGVALEFAIRNQNTLVIVTADHETGGYALSSRRDTIDGKVRSNYDEIAPTFSTGGHTASLIPVFAYGPGETDFNGIYNNHEIYQKMLRALQ